MARPKTHGGGPTIYSLYGEPDTPPTKATVGGHAGSPTTETTSNRGEKQIGGPSGEVYPTPYGGAPGFQKYPTPRFPTGSGDNVGNPSSVPTLPSQSS